VSPSRIQAVGLGSARAAEVGSDTASANRRVEARVVPHGSNKIEEPKPLAARPDAPRVEDAQAPQAPPAPRIEEDASTTTVATPDAQPAAEPAKPDAATSPVPAPTSAPTPTPTVEDPWTP
jgi:hypothetical protein